MKVSSEGPIKITKATIDASWRRRKPGHRLIVRDKDCRGLALIVNPTGMAWSCAYRPRGTDVVTGRRWPNRTVTLGNPATHSPDDARAAANRIKGQAAAGTDPAAEKKAQAATEQRKRAATLSRLVDTYAQILPRRAKMRGAGPPSSGYVAAELAQVRLALAEMNAEDSPAAQLAAADVRGLLANAGTTAHKRFGPLSRFLDWCQDTEQLEANPCAMIARSRRPKAPQARTRYLTVAELAGLWTAAEALREPVWRDITRFLIAVPCRRNEAAKLDWTHIDLAAATWSQHGHMTKNRDPHRFHMHALGQEVLRARYAATGGKGLVFPSPLAGRPIDTFTDIKVALMEAIKSEGAEGRVWTWHDFRRSFATALGEAGIPEAVADAILNHRQSATRGGVLGVYQRATRWPEQVKAMQLWGQQLAAALNPGEADDKVVSMATRAG
jgi:integrase